MNKLLEFIENLETPEYRPLLLENLQQQHQAFEVPDKDTKVTRHNNHLLLVTTRYITKNTISLQLLPEPNT